MSEYEQQPIMQSSEKADLLEKIRPDLIVEVIQQKLMGKEFKNGVWVINQALQKRALTEEGATEISNLMLAVSSQNVSISKLKDDEIKKRTSAIAETAQMMALDNWKAYGIKNGDQLHFINQIVLSNTLITLKQSENEGIRKLLMGTIQEQNLSSSQSSGGGLSALKGLFGGKKNE